MSHWYQCDTLNIGSRHMNIGMRHLVSKKNAIFAAQFKLMTSFILKLSFMKDKRLFNSRLIHWLLFLCLSIVFLLFMHLALH